MTKDVTVGDVDLPVRRSNDSFAPPRMKWDPVESLLVAQGQIRAPFTFPDPSLGSLGGLDATFTSSGLGSGGRPDRGAGPISVIARHHDKRHHSARVAGTLCSSL